MTDEKIHESQLLASASEALGADAMGNCTLFAIKDVASAWGFYPESFWRSGDWALDYEKISQSDIALQVFELLDFLEQVKKKGDVSLQSLSCNWLMKWLR